MKEGKTERYMGAVLITAGWLLMLGGAGRSAEARGVRLDWQQSATSTQAARQSAEQDEEAREQRDEAKQREQERRDREQERLDRQTELYDDAREALDNEKYNRAAEQFAELAKLNGPQTDAALYWLAYADNRLGKRDTALASLAGLKQRFPQSRWLKDAGALEIEVRQSTGQPAKPESQSNDELKMLALQGLLNSDPAKAMPILEKALNGADSPKIKARALFVLAQNGSPQSREILARLAKGQGGNPDLQRKAVEYLGLFGGPEAKQTLADVYASSNDQEIKRAILRSYMISGDKDRLFAAAKGEKNVDLKREAIRQLGLVHAESELQQLYQTETSTDLRRELLQAFFLAGDVDKLSAVAQSDKDPELRRTAIRNLGLVHSDESGKVLQSIYAKETDKELRKEVLNAFFLQGNAGAIVAIAKQEKDPDLKKAAVEKLALMNSKEGTDYLMEILQK
jgi:HEAT repeats